MQFARKRPRLHVCDKADPWFNDHTRVVEQRYKEFGGQITLVTYEGNGDVPLHSADDKRVVDLSIGKTK